MKKQLPYISIGLGIALVVAFLAVLDIYDTIEHKFLDMRFNSRGLIDTRDDIATLDEKFVYSDGSKSSRVWKLKKIGSNQFEGTAGDVEGVAVGETAGNAFYFVYDLNLPVDDTTYVINFEDWMFLMDENTLLSRSYMSKWGFDVGEVTLVMTKTL